MLKSSLKGTTIRRVFPTIGRILKRKKVWYTTRGMTRRHRKCRGPHHHEVYVIGIGSELFDSGQIIQIWRKSDDVVVTALGLTTASIYSIVCRKQQLMIRDAEF